MTRFKGFVPAVLVVATAAATPAFAQNRHEQNRHEPHTQARPVAPATRGEAPRNDVQRSVTEHAVPRAVPRSPESRGYIAPRYENRGRPYYYQPYPVHRYRYYAGPYLAPTYVFRPRAYLHFGVVLGYPVPYAYAYPYPVSVYGYGAPPAPVVVGPSSTQFGGVALQFSPPDAAVYVDGGYAGTVGDFDGSRNTLTLMAGHHRIEISAPGFEPVSIEPDVYPGQIVPYQGSLRPY